MTAYALHDNMREYYWFTMIIRVCLYKMWECYWLMVVTRISNEKMWEYQWLWVVTHVCHDKTTWQEEITVISIDDGV